MSDTGFYHRYGPWAVVLGASDGTGEAFARALADRGVRPVLVARRASLLQQVADSLPVPSRVVVADLAAPDAAQRIDEATGDLDVGLVVYNAGANTADGDFLAADEDALLSMVDRNCSTVVRVALRFGARLVRRGAGGLVLVSSWGAWAGSAGIATYSATKAFDLLLAESLWAEWREHGVDVLALALTATDTPTLRRMLEERGADLGELVAPEAVAAQALDHLADGPTWNLGAADPTGPAPFGDMRRRDAVALLSSAHRSLFAE
ncbi:SDR family NAD(P)-dependent oxidoreductase [Nocardioides sp. YIM 152588]|uniref:SDR family NAD(P)-dependent oxidoreductase n=1 Tax=Nocardioides sp. YIM 152588 TaxID=3158259 RepID=UPI0032E4D172